jgi:hypothetical protein
MESIIAEILKINNKPIKVGKVLEIKREMLDSNICQCAFTGNSGYTEYFMKFDYSTKEIIVFHKNIRKQSRNNNKNLKEQFWKKWSPAQFCSFQDEEKLKFELMNDLDLIINNFGGELEKINWAKISNIGKLPFERDT